MNESKTMALLTLCIFIILMATEPFNLTSSVSLVLFAIAIALICDFIRGYMPQFYKPALLASAFMLSTAIYAFNQEVSFIIGIFYLLPIGLSMLFYGASYGSGMFFLVSLAMVMMERLGLVSPMYLSEQIVMIGVSTLGFGYMTLQNKSNGVTNERWLEKLHVKINELSLLREITNSMQRTTDLKKLNKIILTALTAGYGLGFNRAAIFLLEGNELKGESAVGPLTKAEAYKIWGRLVSNQSSLYEIIEIDEDVDETLSDVIRKVVIDVENSAENPLVQCLKKKAPMKISKNNPKMFGDQLSMLNFENFAIAPLISKNQAIGVLLVDNRFNEKEITDDDVDSLVAFSNQSALAIENISLYDRISTLAITDGLTTVFNHRHFKRTLSAQIVKEEHFSLMVIDIDDFKQFNEKYGHTCGDQVLSEVGKTLKNVIGTQGTVYRYGGDEFTIILPNTSRTETIAFAKKIQSKVETVSIQMVREPLTISIGVSNYPEEGMTESDLFIRADQKLKCSKVAGKNTVT